MKLTTPVKIHQSKIEISNTSKIMTIGSCFSEHIGAQLLYSHFDCLSNPFSTIFNPINISKLITRANQNTHFTSKEIDKHNNRYFSYELHSSYDSNQASITLNKANKSVESAHKFIKDLDVLILTFGTSIGYHHIESKSLVANCHKVPNQNFERRFLEDDIMFSSICQSISLLLDARPDLNIIFTVSPVRHTKEGLVDNNLSKSKLVLLCHKLVALYEQASYFPSYEIIMDELRDYRYYKDDMIHPTPLAVDIIWNRFMDTFFDQASIAKVEELGKLNRAYNHRPFDLKSEGHYTFCKKQMLEIKRLIEKYPEVNFDKYELHFGAQ